MSFSLLKDFFKNYLFSHRAGSVVKKISWLSTLGLFVSVASLIVVISVMTALNHSIRKRTLSIEPHFVVYFSELNQFSLIQTHPVSVKVKNEMNFKAYPFETQDVILRTMDGHFRGAVARGMSEESYRHLMLELLNPSKKNNSSTLTEAKDTEGPLIGEIDIGTDLARSLGVFEGDHLMVVPPEGLLLPPSETPPFEKVKVRKILVTNLADVDSQNIFYKKGFALNSLRSTASKKMGLEVWTPQPDRVEKFKKELSGFQDIKIETWKEKNSAMFFALRLEKSVITLFLSMASLIAAFSLWTVLTLLISQKRKEIGILQAIGFSKLQIQKLFASMGNGLALVGVGSGLILGMSISLYLQFFPLNILPDIYYDSSIPAKLDLDFVLLVILFSTIISVGGSWWSAKSAVTHSPSENLK
jgi:lipoprotein-releasing system permease protein